MEDNLKMLILNFEGFYDNHGIEHNFSTPQSPQQNGVVEKKN